MPTRNSLHILIIAYWLCVASCYTLSAQSSPAPGDRFAFTTISAIPTDDTTYGSGFSLYASVWQLYERYPRTDLFQTGLVSVWMTPQPTGEEPEDFYNTIEGGLGWWTDLRFGHEAPKFIMGGVSNGFYSWANGPGAGQYDLVDGHRDWSQPNGMLDVAQLSNTLVWPPDGLNLSTRNNGEFLGYGYYPLPLTEVMSSTSGQEITTGNQSWTLFIEADNFKGPVAFFLPTFWTKPVLEDPSLEGLFLDTRPSTPVHNYGIETATLPAVHARDDDGQLYFKALPTRYPVTQADESVLLNRPMVYSRDAMWNSLTSWFAGGAVAPTRMAEGGQREVLFDIADEEGSAFMTSHVKENPGGENENDEYLIERDYIYPTVFDANSWGYEMNMDVIATADGLFNTPSYFQADDRTLTATPLTEDMIPDETGLASYVFEVDDDDPLPYLTPLETDCPWHDPEGAWLSPGPSSGPFTTTLEDGSTLTYYWYRFIDQPAIIAANLPITQRQLLQARIELIHTHWLSTDEFLPSPSRGNLAILDDGLRVVPPPGLEIGYVPIVTRQETSTTTSTEPIHDMPRLTIYPNPSHDIIYFSQTVRSAVIRSVDGRIVQSLIESDRVDVSSCTSGIYLLTLCTEDQFCHTQKIIVP